MMYIKTGIHFSTTNANANWDTELDSIDVQVLHSMSRKDQHEVLETMYRSACLRGWESLDDQEDPYMALTYDGEEIYRFDDCVHRFTNKHKLCKHKRNIMHINNILDLLDMWFDQVSVRMVERYAYLLTNKHCIMMKARKTIAAYKIQAAWKRARYLADTYLLGRKFAMRHWAEIV
jgi:hypothetical protein